MSVINRERNGYHMKKQREAARWYATAQWDDWRCGLSDAPQELTGLVREIGNHRVLSAYTAHGAVSCTREFLAKVKPDLVAARDEVYTELRRETVQHEIQQQQQRSIRRC